MAFLTQPHAGASGHDIAKTMERPVTPAGETGRAEEDDMAGRRTDPMPIVPGPIGAGEEPAIAAKHGNRDQVPITDVITVRRDAERARRVALHDDVGEVYWRAERRRIEQSEGLVHFSCEGTGEGSERALLSEVRARFELLVHPTLGRPDAPPRRAVEKLLGEAEKLPPLGLSEKRQRDRVMKPEAIDRFGEALDSRTRGILLRQSAHGAGA